MRSDTSSPRPPSSPLSFDDLVQARKDLQELLVSHRDSINFFATERGFGRTASDLPEGTAHGLPSVADLPAGKSLSGVTTAMTCFESLVEHHAYVGATTGDEARLADEARMDAFIKIALDHPDDWKSEGAARKYCIVRAAAPILLSNGDRLEVDEIATLVDLLAKAWRSVGPDVNAQGLYETAITPSQKLATTEIGESLSQGESVSAPDAQDFSTSNPAKRYPPNSFLTYWGLRAVRALSASSFEQDFEDRFTLGYGWLQSTIGQQVALHFEKSSSADPQQLAWAICGVVIADDKRLAERPGDVLELVRAGLRAFFEQQRPNGSWDRGQPLFHYPEAGNAYCYQYETLGEIVSLALEPGLAAAEDLRRLLLPFLPNLLLAMQHAVDTRVTLEGGLVGWNSGHHPHRRSAESWATAAIYKFLQGLRRLVGLEVRQQAARSLGARKARQNLSTLRTRGDTWDAGMGSAGTLLSTLFVHPVLERRMVSTDRRDPDEQVFVDRMARSAILFGPPGTGKTTLAEAVAGALDWDFIEITPAQFLDEGTAMVSARADAVFRQLMELDQCVVLLDEIDELVRRRTPGSSGPTERFFTTTMLPRLAALWKQRRVIFIANTNGIDEVDHAIRRSQRFDAAIMVMPPSVASKLPMLGTTLASFVDDEALRIALGDDDTARENLGGRVRHGWLAFIRYDQVERLLAAAPTTQDAYLAVLSTLGHELTKTDWELSGSDLGSNEVKLFGEVLKAVRSSADNCRVDEGAPRRIRTASPGASESGEGATEYAPFEPGHADSAGERVELIEAGSAASDSQ